MAISTEKEIDTRLGKRIVAQDKIITFSRGLIGYEDKKDFTLLQIKENTPFLILQSTEEPSLGFLVGDPFVFCQEYQVKVGDAEQLLLKIDRIEQVAVLCMVIIPMDKPEDISMSLNGPILINHEARIGLQVPQSDNKYPTKLFLNSLNK